MKKLFALIMAMLMVAVLFSGCSEETQDPSNDWENVEKAGKLVIGITDYPPVNYYADDGTLIGFDTEFAQAVCDYLGIEPEFVEIDWDNKEIELNGYSIDCIWNGMTYTEERDENMDFSEKYLYNSIVAVIRTEDADKYKTVEDFANATLTAEGGSTGETRIQEYCPDCNYVASDSLASAMMEVASFSADATFTDSLIAYSQAGNGVYADLMVVPDLVLSQEELAIGFRSGSSLVEKINEGIDAMVANGTYAEIAAKYGQTDNMILA
ncbi:MAG TPA: transporter substrate-binding domain-containing protein [Oscillospiraceae bacterium]|nr:transporter substrate-binding domain-containing protein [Oscillospiraceae bacterium]HXK77276.1 transporter substrate-binding domain-containing protein [Oscillospiraceae bacterium]